jgi:hypothetical protein
MSREIFRFYAMTDDQRIKQYWLDREKETGSEILFHTMAKIENIPPPENWTLFYGTSLALFFRYFKNPGLWSSLFGRAQLGEEGCYQVELSQVNKVDFIRERFFLKIFTRSEGKIILRFKNEMLIKKDYTTDVCVLVPIMKVSMIEKAFPGF